MEEIKNMKAFPHPFIVKIIDDFEDSTGHLCLVQELYPDGDFCKYLLKMKLKNEILTESQILHFLANIFLAVFNLNSQNIFHRDIKPENFTIGVSRNKQGLIYLIDLGLSKKYRDSTTGLHIP